MKVQRVTLRPAERAGGKLSLRARVKAFSMTRLQVASERWGARLPSKMVVLALIGGSSSTCQEHAEVNEKIDESDQESCKQSPWAGNMVVLALIGSSSSTCHRCSKSHSTH